MTDTLHHFVRDGKAVFYTYILLSVSGNCCREWRKENQMWKCHCRYQIRANNDDSIYVFHQQKYVKKFAVKIRGYENLVSENNKAIIPVSEPEHVISNGAGVHIPSLQLSDSNTAIAALDHDWKITGIVPSVNLFVDIPESSHKTFFSGQPVVTLKDDSFRILICWDTEQNEQYDLKTKSMTSWNLCSF